MQMRFDIVYHDFRHGVTHSFLVTNRIEMVVVWSSRISAAVIVAVSLL